MHVCAAAVNVLVVFLFCDNNARPYSDFDQQQSETTKLERRNNGKLHESLNSLFCVSAAVFNIILHGLNDTLCCLCCCVALVCTMCLRRMEWPQPSNGTLAARCNHEFEDISPDCQGLYVSTKKTTNVPKYGAPSRKRISKASKQLAATVHLML